jgi:hypothetical protein
MTRRVRLLIAGLVATAAAAAVLTTPAIYAGIALNGID